MKVNRELIEQVNNAEAVILSVEDEIYACRTAQAKLEKAQKKRSILGWIVLLALCEGAASMVSGIITSALGGVTETRAMIVAAVVSLVFLVFSILYWGKIRKAQKIKKYTNQVNELQDIINRQFEKYSHLINVIPRGYRSPEAIKILSQLVNSGRALSMQEALNLTEDEFHKRRVEKANQEMLDKLDEIKSNSGNIYYYN